MFYVVLDSGNSIKSGDGGNFEIDWSAGITEEQFLLILIKIPITNIIPASI